MVGERVVFNQSAQEVRETSSSVVVVIIIVVIVVVVVVVVVIVVVVVVDVSNEVDDSVDCYHHKPDVAEMDYVIYML